MPSVTTLATEIIFLAVGIYVISFIFPPAISEMLKSVNATSTSGQPIQAIDPAVLTLIQTFIPVMIVMVLIFTVIRIVMSSVEFEHDELGETILVNRYKYSLSDSKQKIHDELLSANQLLEEEEKNGI